ncbi:MAG: hypothetical protein WHT06_09200 [Desulfobacterales bacterium]
MTASARLLDLLRANSRRSFPEAVGALAERVLELHPGAVEAVLFYGSCLRTGDDRGGMVDLYALVSRYRDAYRRRTWAVINRVLPPNVYYLEAPIADRRVRAKYAVLSMADFARGVTPAWFHSYLWGRFAQPAALVYARTPEAEAQVCGLLARALLTFLERVIPCLPERFTLRELWLKGLSLSYRAELRAERPEKIAGLFEVWRGHFAAVTDAALPMLPFPVRPRGGEPGQYESRIPAGRRLFCRFGWRLRALQGKLLSILRLAKGAFTFAGGLEYILWKIERHTGVTVEVPPRLRRHPILALCVLSWRLYRRGAFR